MDISKNVYTDLFFHIFAHIKVNNASDIYDEKYIENIEKNICTKTVIPDGFTEYYCDNFERLAFVNFMPFFMVKNVDEMIHMISHTGMTTEEDNDRFIVPLCNIIKDISGPYTEYWNRIYRDREASFAELQNYFDSQATRLNYFFKNVHQATNVQLKVIISESLRCNGRATKMGDMCIVTLPVQSELYSQQQLFMQLVHECTHMMTDPLLDSIRMDDGSHDIAEYQVLLFDLWLFQREGSDLCDAYVKWLSQEMLDESETGIRDEQRKKLVQCFEQKIRT